MTISFSEARQEFPVTEEWAFLNAATYGPLPRANVQAASAFLESMSTTMLGDLVDTWFVRVNEIRSLVGRLLNCKGTDIAFLKSTTEGLCLAALGLSWQDGDEVVSYQLEFPSDVYPWLSLQDRGVKLNFIPDQGRFAFTSEDIISAITDRTRLVCLSLVNFASGYRAPIEEIGKFCRERGIWLVVDAIQAMGALKVDVRSLNADIVVAHGYKFMLSGFGIAVCYCSERARKELRIAQPGWKSVVNEPADIYHMLDYSTNFPTDARRFESGVQSLATLLGMESSVKLMLDLTPEKIDEHVRNLTRLAGEGLAELGFSILGPAENVGRSSVIVARNPEIDSAAVQAELQKNRVSCALREGGVRVSPHLYNTTDDIQRLLDCIRKS